jgi:exodeoxyribonuclease-3
VGWRIDYFGVSTPFMNRVRDAGILPHVLGSDHCQVGITLG